MTHLSPATEAGKFIFLSGALAFGADGQLPKGSIEKQTRQVLENLESVLGGYGLDRNAIVKTTVWLTDTEDFQAFDRSYAAFFGDHRPARATTITTLAIASANVEIEAVAYRGD